MMRLTFTIQDQARGKFTLLASGLDIMDRTITLA